MKTLKFTVNSNNLLVANSTNDHVLEAGEGLVLDFNFPSFWRNCVKVVEFRDAFGDECEPSILRDGRSCMVPPKALRYSGFIIKVYGKNREGDVFTTNRTSVTK